jgi:hypothetical protein
LIGRPRHIWEDNIKTDVKELAWERVDWIHLAQDWDVLGFCECGNELLHSIIFKEFP